MSTKAYDHLSEEDQATIWCYMKRNKIQTTWLDVVTMTELVDTVGAARLQEEQYKNQVKSNVSYYNTHTVRDYKAYEEEGYPGFNSNEIEILLLAKRIELHLERVIPLDFSIPILFDVPNEFPDGILEDQVMMEAEGETMTETDDGETELAELADLGELELGELGLDGIVGV